MSKCDAGATFTCYHFNHHLRDNVFHALKTDYARATTSRFYDAIGVLKETKDYMRTDALVNFQELSFIFRNVTVCLVDSKDFDVLR